MLFNIISKTIAGTVVGYVTNDLAVKMLFRKYLGLGGVVLETREEFIENISALVERDIINHSTLEGNLKTKAFETSLTDLLKSFLEVKILETVPKGLTYQGIPDFTDALAKFKDTHVEELVGFFYDMLQPILKNIKLEELLSPEQLKSSIGNIYQQIIAAISQEKISEILKSVLDENAQKSLQQIIPAPFWDHLGQNTSVIAQDIHQFLKYNYSLEIDQLFEKTIDLLNIKGTAQEVLNHLSKKSLKDFIKDEQGITFYMVENLGKAITSKEGETLIEETVKLLIQNLKNETTTLFDLISTDLAPLFETFLKENLSPLLTSLITWVQEKKPEIEALVDKTFRANTKWLVQDWLVDVFVGSVSEKTQIVGKIVEFLEKYDTQTLAKKALTYIIDFLKTNSIGNILAKFNPDELSQLIVRLIKKNLLEWIPSMAESATELLIKQKIEDWLKPEEIENLVDKGLQSLTNTIKEGFIHTEKLSNWAKIQIQTTVTDFTTKPFSDLFPQEKIPRYFSKINSKAVTFLEKNEDRFFNWSINYAESHFYNQSLFTLISEDRLIQSKPRLVKYFDDFAASQIIQLNQREVQEVLTKINQVENLPERLAQNLITTLVENLPQLVAGRIQQIVKLNLEKQSPDELRKMVEGFMGKEIQPITIFGAILGGLAGLGLAFVPELSNMYWQTSLAGIIYGITGWGTNWLAIQMIFKPYEKKKLFGISLPFTPGVVAKNKPRFAQSMGNFVGKELLSETSLHENFMKNKEPLQIKMIEWVNNDGLNAAEKWILNHKTKLSEDATNYLVNNLANSLPDFLEKNKQFQLPKELFNLTQQFDKLTADPEKIAKQISKQVENYLNKNPKVQDVLPNDANDILQTWLHKFLRETGDKFFTQLNQKEGNSFIKKQLEKPFENIQQKNLATLIDPKNQTMLLNKITNLLDDNLKNKTFHQKIAHLILQKITEEFSPQKPLSEIFDGKLMQGLDKNLDFLLSELLQYGVRWLQDKKDEIAEEVYEKAYQTNKMAFLYKETIQQTVIDLADFSLPFFFEQEKENLQTIAQTQLQILGKRHLDLSSLQLNTQVIEEAIHKLLANKDTNKILKDFVQLTCKRLILEPKIAEILKIFQINSLEDVEILLQEELEILQKNLFAQWQDAAKREELIKIFSQFIQQIVEKILFPYPIKNLFKGIEIATWHTTFVNMLTLFLNNNTFQTQKNEWLTKLQETPLEKWLNIDLLKQDLQQLITNLQRNEPLKKELANTLENLIETLVPQLNKAIPTTTKQFLAEILVKSVLNTLEEHLPTLLNSINLREIVVREIENMPAKEIKELFDSFASKYFTKLINYGFGFGIVAGLLMDFLLIFLIKILQK